MNRPGARTKNGFYTKGKEHPRASATPGTTRDTVHCMSSATPGIVGHDGVSPLLGLPLRLSRPAGQQNARWARRILPSSQAGPNPLGENLSLSSPPLKPRGLLLSVMRQKVGKERSQGVFAPLAIPPPELSELGQALLRADASGLCKEKPSLRVPSGTAKDGDSANGDGLSPKLINSSEPQGRRFSACSLDL